MYTVGELIKTLSVLPRDCEIRLFSFLVEDGIEAVAHDPEEHTVTLYGTYENG